MSSSVAAGETLLDDSRVSVRQWAILALLCVAMIIAYFDRVNLSVVLVLKEFQHLFQLTDHDRGSLNSAFFLTYAVLQIPAGWFVDRYGVKYPLAAAFFFWSIFSAATAMSRSVTQLFSLRLALGASEAVVTPAGMSWIRFNYPEKQRGFAVGLYMAAAKVGPALGAPIAAWLVIASGWRNMFLILGLGSLVWLIPWMGIVKDDFHARIKAEAAKKPAPPIYFGRVLASPVIWGTVIGTFSYQYFVYFCMTWMPAYFVERRGLSLNSMGLYTMFSFLGMAGVATLAGWVADRMIGDGLMLGTLRILPGGGDPVFVRKAFTIGGLLLASTEIIGAFSHSSTVALFFAVFSLSGLGLATANYWALTQTLIPGAAVGRIIGVQNCAASLSGVVAPFLTGWLKEATGSYIVPMLAVVVFLIMGVASYVFLVRQQYAPKQIEVVP